MSGIERHRILKLEIAPVNEIVRDTRKNSKWIALILAIIIGVTIVSAIVAASIDKGFIVTGQQVSTLGFPTAMYFTVINMTTVGFGDIFPVTPEARALAIFNAVFGLITFAAFVSIIMMAFSPSSGGTASLELTDADESGPPDEAPYKKAEPKQKAESVDALRYRDVALETLMNRITAICAKVEAIRPGDDKAFPDAEIADLHAELDELRQGAERLVDKIAVYDRLDWYFSTTLPAAEKEKLAKI
jgi:hypothetical protein